MPPSALKSYRLNKLSSCLALGLAGLQTGIAAAQTETAAALPEVQVSAGRIEQKRFDAPAAVDVIDAETIRDSGPQVNLSDALSSAPGVVSLNRNNYAQDIQISIRGFGARTPFGLRGIRLIADGIPATIPDGQGQSSTVSLTTADRIEVLRGPLAQLYGNSSGGVIQVFSREAPATPEGQAQVYFGSYGLLRSDWQAAGRVGALGIVADYSTFQTDGWRANSAAKREQFNGILTYTPSSDSRFRLILNHFDMPYAQDPLGLTAAQAANDPRQAGTNALLNRARKITSQDQVGGVFEHRFSEALRLQARAYTGTRDNLQYQASATPGSASATWVGLSREFQGAGLQLSGAVRPEAIAPFTWALGFDYDRSAEDRQGGATLNGEKVPGSLTRDQRDVATNRDVYGQVNWLVSDRWTLVAGVRSSEVRLSSQDRYLVDGDSSGSVPYRATSPVLGVTWHLLDTLNLYANLGRGFETPTLSEVAYTRSGNTIVGAFNDSLLPARSRHAELGMKWLPAPGARLDLAVFKINVEDEIVAALSSAGRTAFANATRTSREGIELAHRQSYGGHFHSTLAATWLRARYDAAFTSGGGTVADGNAVPAIPDQQVYASLTWTQHARTVGVPGQSGTEVSLDWFARSQIWANDQNTAAAAGQGVLNLRVRQPIPLGPVKAELFAALNNLTDRAYSGSVIVNQAQRQFYEPALPRNWVLGMRYAVPF